MTTKRKAVSELMATMIMVSVTVVAGAAAFSFVNGQLGVSARSYGNQVAGNINFLNERESIAFVNFPGVGAADTQVTIWIDNIGHVTLSSYNMSISGLYCGPGSDTCANPANTITITCKQGVAICNVRGPSCSSVSSPFLSIPIGQSLAFTLTLPPACDLTFQATAGSPPAPQTVSFAVQLAGQYGSTATAVKNR